MPKNWLNLMKKINFILVILLFASQIQSSNAAQYQSIASIQKAITHYVHTHLTSSSDYKLNLGQIDNRLKLALCNEELTVFSQKISLNGTHEVSFPKDDAIIYHRKKTLPAHSNAMTLTVYDSNGKPFFDKTYYSIGGGEVVCEDDINKKKTDLNFIVIRFI